MKPNYYSIAFAALTTLALGGVLSACVPLMIGGAALGTMVAVDRRTSGAQLEDEGIELRAGNRLRGSVAERGHVTVTSYNRQVLLTGEVASEADKQAAEQIISGVENVRAIVNELVVAPVSSIGQRSSDMLVQGKVKATLVDARDVFAGAFKVVAERGTVYLMGRVTQREADRVTQLTRTVGGVQRVVRVFEIISEQELQGMLPARPAAPATGTSRN